MRGNPEIIVMRNIFCMAAIMLLISSFSGCAAGSCLSYGHSCWGAHGKRSGSNSRPLDSYNALPSEKRIEAIGERLLLSRLLSRQIPPLPAKLRARMLATDQQPVLLIPQSLEEDQDMIPDIVAVKRSVPERRLLEDETSDTALNIDRKDFINSNENQGVNMGYYKFLKSMEDKSK